MNDFPNADHLIGQFLTAETADPQGYPSTYTRRHTLTGLIVAIEGPEDSEARHVIALLASGLRVRLSREHVTGTAPRPAKVRA